MKAIILAAGLGSRLRPITNTIPKCLVPIANKPLLEYWLENLTNNGIKDILINTHYKAEQVENFVKKSKYSKYITLVKENTLLGTAGTLFQNSDFFAGKEGMLIHADNVCEENLENFLNCFKTRPKKSLITVLTFRTKTPQSCGIVEIDNDGLITSYVEKPSVAKSNLANGAVFVFSQKFIKEILNYKNLGNDFCKDILPKFVLKMNYFETKKFFLDIGTSENYKKANFYFNRKKFTGE